MPATPAAGMHTAAPPEDALVSHDHQEQHPSTPTDLLSTPSADSASSSAAAVDSPPSLPGSDSKPEQSSTSIINNDATTSSNNKDDKDNNSSKVNQGGGSGSNNNNGGGSVPKPSQFDHLGAPQHFAGYRSSIEHSIRSGRGLRIVVEDLIQDQWRRQQAIVDSQATATQPPVSSPHHQAASTSKTPCAAQRPTPPPPTHPPHILTKDQIRHQIESQLDRIIANMIADMSSIRAVQFFELVVKNLLARMYHRGIHIREPEIDRLRSIARDAQSRGISLVFLPCHKSHIDYLVISYVLFRLGFALPHIAAGDNLNLPIVGWVLRHNGAFFIRRQWGNDKLYSAVMKEYIETLLVRGHYLEAFIEGTRSRTGKLLQPKFGILKIILEAVASGRVRDVFIVPVSIGYDKVIETPSFADELLGMPKQKESLGQLLSNINILQFKWGRIDVRFGEPFSLKAYIGIESARRGFGLALTPSTTPEVPPTTPSSAPSSPAERKNIMLRSLGYRVLGEINKISVIMPTALVGTTLLTLRGRGVGRTELIRKVRWLRSEIIAKGGHVAEFGNTSLSSIVDRATSVLGDLIGQRIDLLEPVYYPLKRFELSFYRNQVIHLFVAEAIVSVAMYATIKGGGPIKAQRIPIAPNLVDDVSFLSQLLKYEFVYTPGGLGKNLPVTIAKLTQANVVSSGVFDGNEASGPVGGRKWITLSSEERRIGRETFDFYCFLIWPFVETYWLATVSLYIILPERGATSLSSSSSSQQVGALDAPHWVDERLFLRRCQFFGRTLYHEGDLSYFESVNKETLGNAIEWLKDMGIILIRKTPLEKVSHVGAAATAATTTTVQSKQAAIVSVPSNLQQNPKQKQDQRHQRVEQKESTTGTWIALSPSWVPKGDLPKASQPVSNTNTNNTDTYQQDVQQLYEHQHMPYPNEGFQAQAYMRQMEAATATMTTRVSHGGSVLNENVMYHDEYGQSTSELDASCETRNGNGNGGESGSGSESRGDASAPVGGQADQGVGWSGGPLAEFSSSATWKWTMFDQPKMKNDRVADGDKQVVHRKETSSSSSSPLPQQETKETLLSDKPTSKDTKTKVPRLVYQDEDAGLDSWYSVRPSGRLWELSEQIGRFRREGKNRRDTNTVAIRVLRIARLASLWDGGHAGAPATATATAGPSRL